MKEIHIEAGDPSAVAGASKLLSLSNLHKDSSILPPPSKTGENVPQNAEVSLILSSHGVETPDIEMKDVTNNDDQAGVVSAKKTILASSGTATENPNLEGMKVDAGVVDADDWKEAGATCEIRPLLRMLSGSCPEYDISFSISKILEQRELRELLKDVDSPTILASSRRQAFKNSLQEGILKPDDIEVSFETFPYYIRYKCLLPNIFFFLFGLLIFANLNCF